jgi:hypothetical protein
MSRVAVRPAQGWFAAGFLALVVGLLISIVNSGNSDNPWVYALVIVLEIVALGCLAVFSVRLTLDWTASRRPATPAENMSRGQERNETARRERF